jgi:hypothetical protein
MKTDDPILMPAPTPWPLVTAFGLALVVAGMVTHLAVSLVGFVLFARGSFGWWCAVLPVEQHVAMGRPAFDPWRSVHRSNRVVEHLRAGTGGHRVRIPAEIHPYTAGLKGGLVGAAAMALVATGYGVVAQRSLWYAVNLLAAGVVPSLAGADLEHLRMFSGTGLIVGFVMHVALSTLVGLMYAVALPMFPRRAGLWSGLITPIVWSGVVLASLDVVNPTLNSRINWTWFVASQVAFGLTCGFVVFRTERIQTMQSWSFESRVGLEARRPESENP